MMEAAMGIPWTDRQVPNEGEIFLDHVGWMLPNLTSLESVFGTLGFPLTPLAIHRDKHPETGEPILVGSQNRLAMLPLGYLEFLTPVDGVDTVVSQHMRGAIARYEGVHLIAFTVSDAEAYAGKLVERGFELHPPVHLRRMVEGQDGNEVEAAFTVIRAKLGSVPEGRLQALTHLTPEHVWQPRLLPKHNGLIGLAEVVFCVDDPQGSASRLEKFTGRRPVTDDDGSATIKLDRGQLRFLTPTAAQALTNQTPPPAPSVSVIGLFTENMDATAAFLKSTGVTYTINDVGLVIAPNDAAGVALIVYSF